MTTQKIAKNSRLPKKNKKESPTSLNETIIKFINNKELNRIFWYICIGVSVTIAVYALWTIMFSIGVGVLGYSRILVSATQFVASFVGIFFSLILNRLVTFKTDSRKHSSRISTLAIFYIIYSINIGIASIFTYILISLISNDYILFIQFSSLFLNVVLNYIAQRFFIFKMNDDKDNMNTTAQTSHFSEDEDNFDYNGRDLEVMSAAQNYYTWILNNCAQYLGNSIVEVGAGAGSFAQAIMKFKPDSSYILIEPSKSMFSILSKQFKSSQNVQTLNGFSQDYLKDLQSKSIDSIMYSNVLEHVPNDEEELRFAFNALQKDGYIVTFTPAIPFLMSRFDKSIGHYRRYTLSEMVTKMERVGFEVVVGQYFDMFGMLPWFLNFTLLGSTKLNPKSIAMYDKYFVPVLEKIEKVFKPLIGKNILVIAKKTV